MVSRITLFLQVSESLGFLYNFWPAFSVEEKQNRNRSTRRREGRCGVLRGRWTIRWKMWHGTSSLTFPHCSDLQIHAWKTDLWHRQAYCPIIQRPCIQLRLLRLHGFCFEFPRSVFFQTASCARDSISRLQECECIPLRPCYPGGLSWPGVPVRIQAERDVHDYVKDGNENETS